MSFSDRSSSTASASRTKQPVPIHRIAHHHYLYSAPSISHIRATHSIPGTLIGTLPQCPQQNVFLGLPLLLSYAETRRLVTTGAGYIVDDVEVHKRGRRDLGREEGRRWMGRLRDEGMAVARGVEERKEEEKMRVLERLGIQEKQKQKQKGKKKVSVKDVQSNAKAQSRVADTGQEHENDATFTIERVAHKAPPDNDAETEDDFLFGTPERSRVRDSTPSAVSTATATTNDELLFESTPPSRAETPATAESTPPAESLSQSDDIEPYYITPTLSDPPFPIPHPPITHRQETKPQTPSSSSSLPPPPPVILEPPPATPAAHLHATLHKQSYFLLPGLRFGSHFNAYPGDPLRFHAHFLCRALEWDQEVELLELVVGGGRLATGVKKGFLVGGRVAGHGHGHGSVKKEEHDCAGDEGEVRVFCIEWGGM